MRNTKNRIFEIVDKIEKNDKNKTKSYFDNIEKLTIDNNNFRKVLHTTTNLQLVLMSLKPNEDIGIETHPNTDQFFRFESGNGKCIINDKEYIVKDGDVVIIPAGAKHNVINTGDVDLKMYTLYSPPHHKDKTIHKTKGGDEKSKESFDGKTSS
jgi:mannose-6-phosphate isomerase-like protein (cupin superfamily)